jgi:hypothetical protein
VIFWRSLLRVADFSLDEGTGRRGEIQHVLFCFVFGGAVSDV